MVSMKTLYLTKTLLPLLFLPVAPGVLQLELARQGLMTGNWAGLVIAAQGIFTLGLIAWLGAKNRSCACRVSPRRFTFRAAG
jgi:hypothetical protein